MASTFDIPKGDRVVAIVCEPGISLANFVLEAKHLIVKMLGDSKNFFLYQDSPAFVSRLFQKFGFRKAIVFHLGESPRVNYAKHTAVGGFDTVVQLRSDMTKRADVMMYISSSGRVDLIEG